MLVLLLLGFGASGQVTYPKLSIASYTVLDHPPQGINSTIKWSKASLRSDNLWLLVNSSSFSIFINRQIRALNLDSGRWAWLRVLDGFVNSALADERYFIDQSLIVIDLGEFLYGFTGKPGSLQIAWRFRKLGRTSLVGDIGSYDLDGDGKQEILVGGTGAIYILNQSGKLIGSEFRTTDTTIAIQGAQLWSGQRVIVAVHLAQGVQDGNLFVLSPEGRLLWRFTNPHINRFVFIFLPSEAPYPILSAPLVVDLDHDGTSEILLSSGGRLYLLDANGRLIQTLDLSPHDNQQNNIFAEAIASPALYQDRVWVIASEIRGEVKSKTQRGDFSVTDMLFAVSF